MRGATSRAESRAVETGLRVRYSETDQMGIVYHAHYLVWFEIGRTEWCRAAGLPYVALERGRPSVPGIFIPVTRVEAVFRRRPSYDDLIRVRTRMNELSSRGCVFAYEVLGVAGELVAEGSTRHVFTDRAGRPRQAAAEVVETLERFRTSREGP